LLADGWLGLRHRRPSYEVMWMWWGVPLLAYVFLVDDPRTHLYVAYSGWAMVAGLGAASLWQGLEVKQRYALLRPFLLAISVLLILLLAGYQMLIYLPTEATSLKLRANWEGSVGRSLYGSVPKPRSYFGYPRRAGWKAAGWLVSTGSLPDDFRSAGEDFSVPIWYTFETPRSCYEDPELYMIAEPTDDLNNGLRERLAAQYTHSATVFTEDHPRIGLFLKGTNENEPARYDLTDLESEFDRTASPDRFFRGGQPAHRLEAQFGEVTKLSGYTLSDRQVTADKVLSVYLYWQSLEETDVAYRAFVHLGENPVWGQHDDDPACRLPTSVWRTGQTTVGQFRVTPSPEAPPGDYPLVIGLYDPTTGERLPILDPHGQPIGDSLILTTVRVVTS
jgi:hypothetical protein